MKKCKKCGAVQKDTRSVCIDCGTVLGKPLSEEETETVEEELQDNLHGMTERTEDFRVSRADIGLLISHALMTAVMIGMFLWKGSDISGSAQTLVAGVLCNIGVIIELAFPRLSWTIHKWMMHLRYSNADDLAPGLLWIYGRKIISGLVLFVDLWIISILAHAL